MLVVLPLTDTETQLILMRQSQIYDKATAVKKATIETVYTVVLEQYLKSFMMIVAYSIAPFGKEWKHLRTKKLL